MKEFSKVQASRMNIDISTFLVLIRQILDTYVSREETVSWSQMYMFEKPLLETQYVILYKLVLHHCFDKCIQILTLL